MNDNKKEVFKISANPLLVKKMSKDSFLRVAAYCRVSTDSEDQIESYKAQVSYYTDMINKNPKWKLVDIYADEGISGTRTKKRVNFNRMIKDCEHDKIDLILTKSVARFARNTVDSLNYVRKLKAMGIGVYFEEQGLDSLKADSEMFIGLHSVLAQAESENISANVRWGFQQRMKSGTFKFRYTILGYEKGEDGEPKIKEDEAKIIREIFDLYLSGYSLYQIKGRLESEKVLTKSGSSKWVETGIKSILTNERYCGDLLMQKTYIENCITKKHKKNMGELPKYYIRDNHPAIIEREVFNKVQVEMAERANVRKKSANDFSNKGKYSGKYALTNILICGECGSPYRRRVWTKPTYKKAVWRCVNRMENGVETCDNINIEENRLLEAISRGITKIYEQKEDCMDAIKSNLDFLLSGRNEYLLIGAAEKQIKEYKKQIDTAVTMMLKTSGDAERYEKEIKALTEKISKLNDTIKVEEGKINHILKVADEKEYVKKIINTMPELRECNNNLIRRLIESIRVMKDERIIIHIKGGYKIEEKL